MARSRKWLPGGSNKSPAAAPPTPDPIAGPSTTTTTSADAKHFGLENVRPPSLLMRLSYHSLTIKSLHCTVRQHLVCIPGDPRPRVWPYADERPCSYANSVLQALYFCAPFRELLINTPDPSVPSSPALVPAPLHPAAQPTPPPPKRRNTYRGSSAPSEPDHAAAAAGAAPPVVGTVPIPPTPPTLFSALRSLFVHIATHPADKGTVAPRAFVDKLKAVNDQFRTTQQQDAHEFFNYALNLIADEIRRNRREARTDREWRAAVAPCLMEIAVC
jgi:hypothetical protein